MKRKIGIPAVFVLLLLAFLPSARAALRPLVNVMLENLASVNRIGRGFALNNMKQVARGADEIIQSGEVARQRDTADLGIPSDQRPTFNSFLDELVSRAKSLREEARKGNAEKAVVEYRNMVEGGCLPCHKVFRDKEGKLPRVVYLMTSLVNSMEEIDRGVILNDYRLIGVRAREIQHVARLMEWDQIIEVSFKVKPSDRQSFKDYARKLDKAAIQIEKAAEEENVEPVLAGVRTMVTESCLPCHRTIREGGG